MIEDKVFLDTNIIIYAFDSSAEKKHKVAQDILTDLWQSRLGVLSIQVLQEFFVTVTKKIPKPLEIKSTKKIISDFLKWDIVINDGESVLKAIDIYSRYYYSFWDSLIIQAAIKAEAKILLSEDLSPGQTIHGVQIKNPFL